MAHKTHRDPMANWFLFSAFGTALKVAIIVSGGNETVERCSSSVFFWVGGGGVGWKMEMSSRKNARHSAVFPTFSSGKT